MDSEAQRNDGHEFEDTVARWLSVDGWRVEREQLIGHKKVDLLLRGERWGSDWNVAVECKDYERPIDRQTVVQIWSDYEPLVTTGIVNEVLLVSSNGLAPSAIAYVKSVRDLQARTLPDILADAIDFSDYLRSLVSGYSESSDGLPNYYIRPKTLDRRDVEDIVTAWISGESDHQDESAEESMPLSIQPIAVLGAYGIGKSSFAIRLASVLAEEAQKDHKYRIPILIRLGEIAGEQTLEGLLGKHFTATHDVRGYSYRKFRELNKLGRFVIILDGFNEMKQMLSWREFKYNIKQLNKLYEGDSRLVILGRPTAFENDDQHQNILHGLRIDGLGEIRDPDWPDYFEIELSPLDIPEMEDFLHRYLRYRKSPIAEDPAQFSELWYRVVSKQLKDIARRPVQLRMLAEILPGYGRNLEELNVTRVYDIFITKLIDDIIAREDDKYSRLAFSAADRRQFLAEFALWLWQSQHGTVVSSDQVPLELVQPFARGEDLESVRRDLIVGSPLDRRLGERIRFPHRSFQEFLVAEAIWEQLRDGKMNLGSTALWITDEVGNFMKLQRGRDENATVLGLLPRLRGLLPWVVVDAILLDSEIIQSIHRRVHKVKAAERRSPWYSRPTPWEILILTCSAIGPGSNKRTFDLSDLAELAAGSDHEVALMCLFCCLLLGSQKWPHADSAITNLIALIASSEEEVVRFTTDNVNRIGIHALAGGYVGRRVRMGRRNDKLEIGRVVGRGHITAKEKGKKIVVGAEHLEVRWIPTSAADLMRRLQIQHSGRRIDLRGLRPVFASFLAECGFIEDWYDGDSLDNSVRLVDAIEIGSTNSDLVEKIGVFRNAYDELENISERASSNTSKRTRP